MCLTNRFRLSVKKFDVARYPLRPVLGTVIGSGLNHKQDVRPLEVRPFQMRDKGFVHLHGAWVSVLFGQACWGEILLDVGKMHLSFSNADGDTIGSSDDELCVSQQLSVTKKQIWAFNQGQA